MTEQPPVSPPPPEPPQQPYQQAYQPPQAPPPAPAGGWTGAPPPAPGVPRPGDLLDRFLARLIDGVILGVAYFVLSSILAAFLLEGLFDSRGELFVFYLILGPITAALWLGYSAVLESSKGATIGKQAMKLRVVGPDGVSNPTMEQAIRRNIWMGIPVVFVVPIAGPLLGGLAILVAEIMAAVTINNDTTGRQGWHDKLAGGTRVLKIG
jgi:uncharacterized RDD family membrane protein YckC